jgi:PKHD-type hydroxylase
MNPIAQQFKNNKYVYLQGVINKEDCKEITDHLFKLSEEGKMTKDDQCPLSESIYDDLILKAVLDNLKEPLSNALGIDLKPAYCYARIYRPGEVLERHVDRPACEISGTLTLGHDEESTIWPIYFAENEKDLVGNQLSIDIGDLVMYRGEELPHWREAYKGKWQTQVFFHYVDANGNNANHANDNARKNQEIEPLPIKKFQPGYITNSHDGIFPGLNTMVNPEYTFTSEECDKIVAYANDMYKTVGTVGTDSKNLDESMRTVDVYDLPMDDNKFSWIFTKILNTLHKVNTEYYKYSLSGITHSLQLLHYKPGGHYDWHIDCGHGEAASRKLSIVIPLSNPLDFEGGELLVNNNGVEVTAISVKGSITTFPSFMLHKVTPVTKGERWSLVIWVHGADRFK